MLLEVDFGRLAAPPAGGSGVPAGVRLQPGTAAVATAGGVLLVLFGQPRRPGGAAMNAAALLALCSSGTPPELHGAYAFALVGGDGGRVLLQNDRMAVHGWCWSRKGPVLRIADRADTLGADAELDPQALFTYLFNHVIPSPDTVFKGVQRLPPAHRMVATAAGDTAPAPHWKPAFAETRQPDLAALRDEFRALVQGSVSREMHQHAGAASFLSGGTDSSTVSGMLRHAAGAPVRAYSIGFDADGYDEMDYARIAARHFGLDHREHYLTPAEVVSGMPLVAAFYDQPFGNSSAVAAYHCARVAREEGCGALFAGDGGDELFGGNARYAKQSLFGLYERAPAPLRRGVLEPLLDNRAAAAVPGLSKVSSYVSQARVPMPDRLHMYNLLQRLGLDQVLSPGFLAQVDPGHDIRGQRAVYGRSQGASLVNRMLAYDWKYTLADNDLPKVVGTTQLAGIGVAFPLLADEIVDFSLRLPSSYKLKGQELRWFFKEALRGFLPDAILAKKKQGFGLPFGVWALRDAGLARLADDALASFGTRGVIAPAFVRRLQDELLPAHPGYYGELVWIIAMLELWLREKRPGFRMAG